MKMQNPSEHQVNYKLHSVLKDLLVIRIAAVLEAILKKTVLQKYIFKEIQLQKPSGLAW